MMSTLQRPLARSFWYSVGVFIVFNSLFLALVLIKPGTHYQFMIADDVGQALGWLLGTLLCFVGFERPWLHTPSGSTTVSTIHSTQRWIPLLLALGIFCQFIGQVIYTYYDVHHWVPFPSWADLGYLSTYPFLLVAILLLPTRPLSGTTRSLVILDGFMTMIALVTFSWYFVLGPTMFQGYETILSKIVGSAYPFFDLILIFCVLRLALRESSPALWPAVPLLTLALLIIVISDTIYDYQTLQNAYVNGWQDIGWPIGYMLIALAAQTLHFAQPRVASVSAPHEGAPRDAFSVIPWEWRHVFLPYAFIPALILLIVYVWRIGTNGALEQGVYLGGVVLIGLVVVRQFLAVRETISSNKQLQRMQQELHQKNQALSEAHQQVAAAYIQERQLNELKDQFLLHVNHELRTPLTEMYGYLELLLEHHRELDDETQIMFLTHSMHGCEELLHLVNNVLDAARSDFHSTIPQFTDVSVSAIVHEVLALFKSHQDHDHSIIVEIPEDLTVRADQQHLRQVLLNLLSNAFKYSPKQSPVVVSAELFHNSTADSSETREVCIAVQDRGPGIPPEDIPQLFGKFVRLKRDLVGSVRGTGLGLYICKQLVEGMEGRIWVESSGKAGEGSRFCLTLPASKTVLQPPE